MYDFQPYLLHENKFKAAKRHGNKLQIKVEPLASNYMFQLCKNLTDFLGQTFQESFQFKTSSLVLGHPVSI